MLLNTFDEFYNFQSSLLYLSYSKVMLHNILVGYNNGFPVSRMIGWLVVLGLTAL